MDKCLRKTLIASAIAALISAPAWAAEDSPARAGGATQTQGSGATGGDAQQRGAATGSTQPRSAQAQGGQASDNPLYAMTPDELEGADIVDSSGEKIGEISSVMLDPTRNEVHVLVSTGGFLGIGGDEMVLSLDDLNRVANQMQVNRTSDDLRRTPQQRDERYVELDQDRPISEFAAFEGQTERSGQTGAQPQRETTTGTTSRDDMGPETNNPGESMSNRPASTRDADRGARATTGSDHPLYARTPDDLEGADVVNADGEKIGDISSVVLDPTDNKVHAMISIGGFMGMGDDEIAVSLDELERVRDDEYRINRSSTDLQRSGKREARYVELESDRPISEFSAFESGSQGAGSSGGTGASGSSGGTGASGSSGGTGATGTTGAGGSGTTGTSGGEGGAMGESGTGASGSGGGSSTR